MKNCISPAGLKSLSDLAAAHFGLAPVTRREIDALFAAEVPIPLLRRGGDAVLWIDRYYLAFQEKGKEVRYLYLSALHIAEERAQEKRVRCLRRSAYRLPEDVRAEFDRAEKAGVFRRGYVTDDRTLARLCGAPAAFPPGVEKTRKSCIMETEQRTGGDPHKEILLSPAGPGPSGGGSGHYLSRASVPFRQRGDHRGDPQSRPGEAGRRVSGP